MSNSLPARRRRSIISVVSSTLLLALVGISCGTKKEPSVRAPRDTAPDLVYLQSAGAEWDRRFNERDLTGLVALYAEDVISMPFNAPTIHGRRALQADFESFFAQNDGRHETRVEEVLSKDDWAIERAQYVLTYTPKAGGSQIVESGRHVVCRKKLDGYWVIAWEIWNTDTPSENKK